MNKLDFLKQLRLLVSESNLEEALCLLNKYNIDSPCSFSNDIIMLKGQLHDAKQQFRVSVIENIEYNQIKTKIKMAILEIADSIENKSDSQNSRRIGHVIHKIPTRMTTHQEIKCIVRIAYNLDEIIKDLLIDEDTLLQEVQITEVMSVQLIDTNETETFKIRTCTDEDQFIIFEDFTQWIFWVMPLREGRFPLVLKIAAVENINGKERKRNIVLEKEITILSENIEPEKIEFTSIGLGNKYHIEIMKTHQDLTYSTLKKFFSSECSIAGSKNVVNISSGSVKLVRIYGGSDIDITEILDLLINSASFIANVITVITFLKKEKKQPPTLIEINNIIIETKMVIGELPTPEKRNAIYSYLLKELEKNENIIHE